MQSQLAVKDPQFLFDFILVQARACWPDAVLLDEGCGTRDCTNRLSSSEYGYDIFPSQKAVEEFVEGTAQLDSTGQVQHVNVRLEDHQIYLWGDSQVIHHLSLHPLWR